MDYDCVKEMKCCSNGCYKICIPPADDAVTAPAAAGQTLNSMTTQSYKSVFIVSNYCKKKRISFTLPPIGVGRGKGSWGTRKPPLKAFLGKQPTIFRWRKRHDDILTAKKKHFWKAHFCEICFVSKYFRQRLLYLVNMGLHTTLIRAQVKRGLEVDMIIWWVPSVWHNVRPLLLPFEKSWLRPCVHNVVQEKTFLDLIRSFLGLICSQCCYKQNENGGSPHQNMDANQQVTTPACFCFLGLSSRR